MRNDASPVPLLDASQHLDSLPSAAHPPRLGDPEAEVAGPLGLKQVLKPQQPWCEEQICKFFGYKIK